MNRTRASAFLGLLAVTLGGCAADQAQAPAKLIGGEVAKFHADLSQFQDNTRAWQGYSATRITGSAVSAAAADATSMRLQTEWTLRDAKSDTEVFRTLRDQASADLAAQTTTPPPLPALTRAAFPLDELSSVAGGLDKIAEPRSFVDDAKALIAFGKTVNDQLKKLEEDAAKKATDGN